MMEDLENLAKSLTDLLEAISTKSNVLGVDQDEYWMRTGQLAVSKILHRTRRLAFSDDEHRAFAIPLLCALGAFEDAKIKFESQFSSDDFDELNDEMSELEHYVKIMKESRISTENLLRRPIELLENKYSSEKFDRKEVMNKLTQIRGF